MILPSDSLKGVLTRIKKPGVQIGNLLRHGQPVTSKPPVGVHLRDSNGLKDGEAGGTNGSNQPFRSMSSGQIVETNRHGIVLRKGHPFICSKLGQYHVEQGRVVEKNSPVFTLYYQRLTTGDIVQGIPKVEQLFEARETKEGQPPS